MHARDDMTATKGDLDLVLTLQLAVAWAGEGLDTGRLGWWQTELASEWAGEDLFRRLLPETWRWATLQSAREAAIRVDHGLRAKGHAPDTVLTLYALGFGVDELLAERLSQLKQAGGDPLDALPGLGAAIHDPWDRDRFQHWLAQFPSLAVAATPTGRRIKSSPPEGLDAVARALTGALMPLHTAYPAPYFQRPSRTGPDA
jgi:hypothetical protein